MPVKSHLLLKFRKVIYTHLYHYSLLEFMYVMSLGKFNVGDGSLCLNVKGYVTDNLCVDVWALFTVLDGWSMAERLWQQFEYYYYVHDVLSL